MLLLRKSAIAKARRRVEMLSMLMNCEYEQKILFLVFLGHSFPIYIFSRNGHLFLAIRTQYVLSAKLKLCKIFLLSRNMLDKIRKFFFGETVGRT